MQRSLLSPVKFASVIAIAAPAAAQLPAPPATVAIALSNFSFAPSTIHLAAGQPVRLVYTNVSRSSHDFTAPAFFAHAAAVTGPVEHGGEVQLSSHSSASVTLVPARGTYKARCTHFGHTMMGMSATIIID